MDTLEAFRERRADAQQHGALRRPVARAAAAVHLTGYHDQRHAGLLVAHGRIEQRTISSLMKSRVQPPFLPSASLLDSFTLANVPRIMTSWLPRRAP